MCACVCEHVCVLVCAWTCICLCVHAHVYMHLHGCTCIHVCEYVCACVCMCTCIRMCTCMCTCVSQGELSLPALCLRPGRGPPQRSPLQSLGPHLPQQILSPNLRQKRRRASAALAPLQGHRLVLPLGTLWAADWEDQRENRNPGMRTLSAPCPLPGSALASAFSRLGLFPQNHPEHFRGNVSSH